MTPRRNCPSLSLCVVTFMPAATGVVHEAGKPFMPSTCTRQSRHDPNASSSSVAQSFGIVMPASDAARSTDVPAGTRTSMPSIVKNDPGFWLDPKNEPLEAYTKQGVLGPTIPPYEAFNPARADVSTEHVFAIAMTDVINNGMTPEAAIDKAFRRCEAIFAKYPIVQA